MTEQINNQVETLQQQIDELQTKLAASELARFNAETRFKMIYELSNSFIMAHDEAFQIVYMNPYACQQLGYTPEELLGTDIRRLLEQSEYERAEPIREKVAIDPDLHVEGFEQYYLRRDGERVLINWNVSALKDKDGQAYGIIGVGQNITAQRQAEAELEAARQDMEKRVAERTEALQRREKQLSVIIENMPVMVDAFDEAGNIIIWNAECERVSGYSAAEIVNNPQALQLLYPDPDYRQRMMKQWAEMGHNYRNWEWDITAKDGTTKTVSWSNISAQFPIEGWANWGVGVEVTDLRKAQTERDQAQQEIIEAQKQAIQELSVPIIPVMAGIIVMPLIGSIDSMRARDLMRTLLQGITQYRAKVVILDITGVPIVDTGVVAHLDKTIQAARLKGSRTIVTGISDAVAESIVDLGIDWSHVETLRDLQTGLVVALDGLGLRLAKED